MQFPDSILFPSPEPVLSSFNSQGDFLKTANIQWEPTDVILGSVNCPDSLFLFVMRITYVREVSSHLIHMPFLSLPLEQSSSKTLAVATQ